RVSLEGLIRAYQMDRGIAGRLGSPGRSGFRDPSVALAQVAVGLAHRAVQVQDELVELTVLMGLVVPSTGDVHQVIEVVLGAEGLGLEAAHLAGGSGLGVFGRNRSLPI